MNQKKGHGPYATFFVIHFEVGPDTRRLDFQEKYWSPTVDFIGFADSFDVKLTLQFNPQWAEFIVSDRNRHELLRQWREQGHEIALHHHAYDHSDWNGYTNRSGKDKNGRYRGDVCEMMEIMEKLAHPGELLSGTISDEALDYPETVKYDTEGVLPDHARRRPAMVSFSGREVLQFGMGCMPFDAEIESFRNEYLRSDREDVFGVITHEVDLSRDISVFKEWFSFVKENGLSIRTVSDIASRYLKEFDPERSDEPLTYSKDVQPGMAGIRRRLKDIADRLGTFLPG